MDLQSFLDEINQEDFLQIIIRGHLYIESRLIQLIRENLHRPDAIDLSKINFPTKLDLCVALGVLDEEEKKAYLHLNKLRNKFAHNLDALIDEDEIEAFLSDFSEYQISLVNSIESKNSMHRFRKGIAALYVILNERLKAIKEEGELFHSIIPLFQDYKK
jgi:DNA-binding MltR family transcriptional regulator